MTQSYLDRLIIWTNMVSLSLADVDESEYQMLEIDKWGANAMSASSVMDG